MTNEALLDIVREMRNYAESLDYAGDYEPAPNTEPLRNIADRLEAAAKRETGNVARLREALCEIQRMAHEGEGEHDLFRCQQWAANINNAAKAALAEPPRNCDVGTAEEQARRFYLFCQQHRCFDTGCSTRCPFVDTADINHCQSGWAQMPYEAEKGEADGV